VNAVATSRLHLLLPMTLAGKRRLEAIEFSVFEATEDVAFCG
jgi:hypothetical protein